jgi:hypothetical protein
MVWSDSGEPLRDFSTYEWRTEEQARDDLEFDREHFASQPWYAFHLIRKNDDGSVEVVEA